MRTIVTRYAGAFDFTPPNQRRFKNAFKMPTPEATPAPAVTPPPPMPDLNSPAAIEAARKASETAMRGGRQSTILTTASSRAKDTVAGGYTANRLGAQ